MPDLGVLADWAQIVSVLLASIALLVSVVMYRRGRQRRALLCEFDSIVYPVEIEAGTALAGDLEIHYRGEPVRNLFVVRATLENNGNAPIRKSHVLEPVTFVFPPGTDLLCEPKVVAKKPSNLKISWNLSKTGSDSRPSAAILDFDLLMQHEVVITEFTCTGTSTWPQVTARIEGIPEIKVVDPEMSALMKKISSAATSLALPAILTSLLLIAVAPMILRPSEGILPEAFKGLSRSALLVGLWLGALFTFGVMQTIEWVKWTWDIVRSRPSAARKKVEKTKDEIQEIEQEARQVRRIGFRVGVWRAVIYLLVALILAMVISTAWQMSPP